MEVKINYWLKKDGDPLQGWFNVLRYEDGAYLISVPWNREGVLRNKIEILDIRLGE